MVTGTDPQRPTSSAEALIAAALDRGSPADVELAGAGIDRATWHWFVERLARCGAGLLDDASAAGRGWTEVCVATDDIDGVMSAWLRSDGPSRIGSAVRDGLLEHFFFVYKPPGLRLRFRVRDAVAAGRLPPVSLMTGFEDCSLHAGVYEPEVPLLGIGAGLAATHAFFTADSLAVINRQRRWLDAPADGPDPGDYSLAVCQATLRAATADGNEAWAVWHRLATRDRPPHDGVAYPREPWWDEAARRALDPAVLGIVSADPAVRAVVECGRAIVAGRLRESFPCGLRATLAHWIVFHWNRMGFGVDVQRHFAAAMERVLRPGDDAPRAGTGAR